MVLAMRHGVLGYEAMGHNRTFHNPPFGVFSYEATRTGSLNKTKEVAPAGGAKGLIGFEV
jgi:hypothetical protein